MDKKKKVSCYKLCRLEEAFESHLLYFMRLIPAQLMSPCLRELRGGEMMKRQRFPHYEKIK